MLFNVNGCCFVENHTLFILTRQPQRLLKSVHFTAGFLRKHPVAESPACNQCVSERAEDFHLYMSSVFPPLDWWELGTFICTWALFSRPSIDRWAVWWRRWTTQHPIYWSVVTLYIELLSRCLLCLRNMSKIQQSTITSFSSSWDLFWVTARA